ncbi:hypothetical protein [Streptomyces hiroshimensis]
MPGNTWEYYKVLREIGGPVWSPGRDTLPWIKFNLLAYHQQAQRVHRRVDRSNNCWMQLMDAADAHRVTERQLTALHEVAMVGRVRRSRYEKAEALNTQQATRGLQALTKDGLLTAVGQTKGRHSAAGPSPRSHRPRGRDGPRPALRSTTCHSARPHELAAVAELRWRWVQELYGTPGSTLDEFVPRFVAWARETESSHRCMALVRDGLVIGMAWLAITQRVPHPGTDSKSLRACSRSRPGKAARGEPSDRLPG